MAFHSTFWCNQCASVVQLDEKNVSWCGGNGEGPRERIEFGTCIRCLEPAVLRSMEVAQGEWDVSQVFPIPIRRKAGTSLPPKVAESYDEAMKCWSAGAYLATAVMVRRTLEAIARTYDASVRSPAKGIDVLKAKGLISEEIAAWGHELRFLGNIGAHPTEDVVGLDDARDSMDFLEAIVQVLFELRPKFDDMRKRRNRMAKAPSPPAGLPAKPLEPKDDDGAEDE